MNYISDPRQGSYESKQEMKSQTANFITLIIIILIVEQITKSIVQKMKEAWHFQELVFNM